MLDDEVVDALPSVSPTNSVFCHTTANKLVCLHTCTVYGSYCYMLFPNYVGQACVNLVSNNLHIL